MLLVGVDFFHQSFSSGQAFGPAFRHDRFGPLLGGLRSITPTFRRKGQHLLFGPVFLPPSAHESRRLLALPFIPLAGVPFGPSITVPGSAYLLLRLSALECLSSLADCMIYFAFC